MEERCASDKISVFLILAALFVPALTIQSRSVNLALETSFLFDPQDVKENATFLNKVQSVLDKLKAVLEPPSPAFRTNGKGEDKVILTRFLSQIGSSLIKFDNNDIKKVTNDLRDAVYKHAEKNKEFDELFVDERLRAFIKNTVRVWADTDPMVLKVEIAKYITSVDTDAVIELFQILNKVFDTADEPKFKKLEKKFKKSIKHKDYTKFLTKTIDFIVFKRFKKLNFLLQQLIKDELKKFTEYVSKEFKDRIVDIKDNHRFSLSSIARGERLPEVKYSSDSSEKALKTERVSTIDEKQDEIVIDKDLNLNVRANDNNGLTLNMN